MADTNKNSNLSKTTALSQKIVDQAQKAANELLNSVEDKAKKIIADLQAEKKKEFESRANHWDLSTRRKEESQKTQEDIQHIFKKYETIDGELSDFLMNRVTSVRIELSRNVIGDYSQLRNETVF
jgi:hypothetical protein